MRYLVLALALFSFPARADAITRYYFRIHVFMDRGLEIFESVNTWGKFEDCEKAAERDTRRYQRWQMANYICEPIHIIINTGGRYT